MSSQTANRRQGHHKRVSRQESDVLPSSDTAVQYSLAL